MDAFVPYSIPIQGLKVGIHEYQFELDQKFFSLFDGSPVPDSAITYDVQMDKRPDMLLFAFQMKGSIHTECDRCTAMIDLPLSTQRQLIVKFGEAEGETEDEVVFIHRESSDFNVARYLYEFTVLALPLTNIYDCQSNANPPCNQEILSILQKSAGAQESNSIWDSLKNLK